MRSPLYDKIGKTYDATRRADPEIITKIINLLNPNKNGYYVDIGCGSGNYTNALAERGYNMCGVDISPEMLAKAQIKNPNVNWVQADACDLPFLKSTFDGAICILATHHIGDLEKALRELYRVISGGRVVIFTALPEQIQGYWLWHYFPGLKAHAMGSMAPFDMLSKALMHAGFKTIKSEKYFITRELQDWFLHAGKYRPEIYLDSRVRSGISTFAMQEEQEDILLGCSKLDSDIRKGKIKDIINSHENDAGDYLFVVAEK